MKLFFIIFSLFLTGCSFSKSNSHDIADDKANSDQLKISPISLTEIQKEIIAAVKMQNIERLQKYLDMSKPVDFIFPRYSETPMQLALQLENNQIVEMLVKYSVDIYNYGSSQRLIEQKIFSLSMRKTRSYFDKKYDSGERLLSQKYDNLFSDLLNIGGHDEFFAKLKEFRSIGISCDVFEKYLILALHETRAHGSTLTHITRFLSDEKCGYSKGDPAIQDLYKMVFFEGMKSSFKNFILLSYLRSHPALVNGMIEIVPGVFMGPRLLYRIAYSPEAARISGFFARSFKENDQRSSESGPISDVTDDFPENYLRSTVYELVRVRNGRVEMAFEKFPRQLDPKWQIDLMYYAVAQFVSGDDPDMLPRLWSSYVPVQALKGNAIVWENKSNNDTEKSNHLKNQQLEKIDFTLDSSVKTKRDLKYSRSNFSTLPIDFNKVWEEPDAYMYPREEAVPVVGDDVVFTLDNRPSVTGEDVEPERDVILDLPSFQ